MWQWLWAGFELHSDLGRVGGVGGGLWRWQLEARRSSHCLCCLERCGGGWGLVSYQGLLSLMGEGGSAPPSHSIIQTLATGVNVAVICPHYWQWGSIPQEAVSQILTVNPTPKFPAPTSPTGQATWLCGLDQAHKLYVWHHWSWVFYSPRNSPGLKWSKDM